MRTVIKELWGHPLKGTRQEKKRIPWKRTTSSCKKGVPIAIIITFAVISFVFGVSKSLTAPVTHQDQGREEEVAKRRELRISRSEATLVCA